MKRHKLFKAALFTLSVLAATAGLVSCEDEVTGSGYAEWAGVRRSNYGEFGGDNPKSPKKMTEYVNKMSSFYNKNESEKSTGALVWIVGEVSAAGYGETDKVNKPPKYRNRGANKIWEQMIESNTVPDGKYCCRLNFPFPENSDVPPGLTDDDEDFNESYLTAFDIAGFDVWLQVEAGYADIVKVAKIVMTKYKNHKCVKGFGVDVEWYRNVEDGKPGQMLTDEVAQNVDAAVKSVNPSYSVFVKHWETGYLPPSYRGVNNDMIFVTDSQDFGGNRSALTKHYRDWANYYEPNPVFFQIAYEDDEDIWNSFDNPLADYGEYILTHIEDSSQKRGIIWVDFTFNEAYSKSN